MNLGEWLHQFDTRRRGNFFISLLFVLSFILCSVSLLLGGIMAGLVFIFGILYVLGVFHTTTKESDFWKKLESEKIEFYRKKAESDKWIKYCQERLNPGDVIICDFPFQNDTSVEVIELKQYCFNGVYHLNFTDKFVNYDIAYTNINPEKFELFLKEKSKV